jgi:hypothetical protein
MYSAYIFSFTFASQIIFIGDDAAALPLNALNIPPGNADAGKTVHYKYRIFVLMSIISCGKREPSAACCWCEY